MAKQVEGIRIRGYPAEVNVSQEFETVYSYTPVPDPDWTYTDNQGHEHFFDRIGFVGVRYPTLEWVETRTYWCDMCRDQHTDGEYRCRECGEVIEPGTRQPQPETIPTRREIEIVVYGDAGDEFEYEVQGEGFRFEKVGHVLEAGNPMKSYYIATEKIE